MPDTVVLKSKSRTARTEAPPSNKYGSIPIRSTFLSTFTDTCQIGKKKSLLSNKRNNVNKKTASSTPTALHVTTNKWKSSIVAMEQRELTNDHRVNGTQATRLEPKRLDHNCGESTTLSVMRTLQSERRVRDQVCFN